MRYYFYLITNYTNTTLYAGVTNSLSRRTFEHKTKVHSGFTARYHVYKLVYAEEYMYIDKAIEREKQVKNWSRKKKDALVQSLNPTWKDLFSE